MSYRYLTISIVFILFQYVTISIANHPHGITSDGTLGIEVMMM